MTPSLDVRCPVLMVLPLGAPELAPARSAQSGPGRCLDWSTVWPVKLRPMRPTVALGPTVTPEA